MKSKKRKVYALMLALATPGMAVLSCSGLSGRTVRDGALTGVGNYATATAFNMLVWYMDSQAGRR